jgi:hypothetical protein
MLLQVLWYDHPIAEISCPTRYYADSSSINFRRSVRYGLGCLATALLFRLSRLGMARTSLFPGSRVTTR